MTSTTVAGVSWSRLPADILFRILELLLDDDTSCAGAAAVSRQWQAVIEPRNFARIKVTPSRLADFDSMTYRNRHLVRYLWLCLELEEYSSMLSDLTNADNHLIATSFQTLFENLSSWDPHGNLTLDISIHSPSDAKGESDYLTFESDIPACEIDHDKWAGKEIQRRRVRSIDHLAHFSCLMRELPSQGRLAKQQSLKESNSLRDSWLRGEEFDFESSVMRIQEADARDPDNLLEPGHIIWQRLPTVPAVTSVLLRQQTRRIWPSKQLSRLFSRLPRIQEIHYEPWREWLDHQDFRDKQYKALVRSLPHTLKTLVLFENFNQHYIALYRNSPLVRAPSLKLSQAIAKVSLNLECLSASYLVDASFFFDAYESSGLWPHLRSIALTAQSLSPDASKKTINALLQKAATAVLRMPKLETLEIWNGEKGVAALLRYQPSRATLTWRATWELDILSSAIQAFEKVGPAHCVGRCDIVKELLDVGLVASHGDAINLLKHVCPILRPISLQQILTEERFLET
ncbi:unnamed protein product [Clonostachys byssicola]|uniref:F-box domain-containing protein n=1 Tax=Clonostachys byssicola TaxID=160290 RepID=A0A9N9Y2R3_9HYPO|nr:unnamed protein product [Clonostachys byssicola]